MKNDFSSSDIESVWRVLISLDGAGAGGREFTADSFCPEGTDGTVNSLQSFASF